jgi:hypothetical protein
LFAAVFLINFIAYLIPVNMYKYSWPYTCSVK